MNRVKFEASTVLGEAERTQKNKQRAETDLPCSVYCHKIRSTDR